MLGDRELALGENPDAPPIEYLKDVIYVVPEHKLYPPRHRKIAEAEQRIVKMLSSSRHRLRVGIHEAGHSLAAKKFGVQARYAGPLIQHFKERDCWLTGYGQTEISTKDWLGFTPEQAAEFSVAGRVAEVVLLGDAPVETSETDLRDYIYSGKNRPSELILLWKQAEERMIRELRADLAAQQQIVHEAAVFERNIFPDCIDSIRKFPSIRTGSASRNRATEQHKAYT